jgi:hypothetical protein
MSDQIHCPVSVLIVGAKCDLRGYCCYCHGV